MDTLTLTMEVYIMIKWYMVYCKWYIELTSYCSSSLSKTSLKLSLHAIVAMIEVKRSSVHRVLCW